MANSNSTIEAEIRKTLEGLLLNPSDIDVWLDTPSADLSGHSPNQVIKLGRADAVLSLVKNAELGNPA